MKDVFVGITGVSSLYECQWLIDLTKGHTLASHAINAGILVSSVTLAGGKLDNPLFPDFVTATHITKELQPHMKTIIHHNTRSPENLMKELREIFLSTGIYQEGWCRQVQINNWEPEPHVLEAVVAEMPDLRIILQVPMTKRKYRLDQNVIQFIERCLSFASNFILDPSGGRGLEMSEENLDIIRNVLAAGVSPSKLVFAGGLSNENVSEFVSRLISICGSSEFSIDSQKKLCGGHYMGADIEGVLNPEKVSAYVKLAFKALG